MSFADYQMIINWCIAFRSGDNPNPAALLKFKPCPGSAPPTASGLQSPIQNIFNLMSYSYDACRMGLTKNQVARLQWAIMTYRPNLMRKYAVD